MIKVTRFNGTKFVINADLIEFIEETPDTVISLITGRKVLVKEASDEVIDLVVAYRRRVGYHPAMVQHKAQDEGKDQGHEGKK